MVDALPAGLAAVYCTPAHQYPLGARLSAARRVALVERARAEGFLVIEDDYDGELRYDVAPLPLLAALGPDVVAHLGTASKLLTPTLGVGWLVAPPAVRAAVLALRERTGGPAGPGRAAGVRRAGRARRPGPAPAPAAPRAGRPAGRGARRGGRGRARWCSGTRPARTWWCRCRTPPTERAVLAAAAARGVALDGLARHHARSGGAAPGWCSATPGPAARRCTAPSRWSPRRCAGADRARGRCRFGPGGRYAAASRWVTAVLRGG